MPIILAITGIHGSCNILGYEGYLVLDDFSWGGTRGSLQQRSADRRSISTLATAPQLRAIKAVRQSDHLTPEIWSLMLSLTKQPMEFVWLRTGAGEAIPYMKLLLENALITSMSEEAEGSEPTETIVLTYETITLTVVNVGNRLSGPQDVVTYNLPQAMRG